MLRSSVRRGQVEADGTDFLVPFADGWGKDDTPFSCASCGYFGKIMESMPDRVAILPLMADFQAIKTITKAAKPPDYLCGRTTSGHFCLEPCPRGSDGARGPTLEGLRGCPPRDTDTSTTRRMRADPQRGCTNCTVGRPATRSLTGGLAGATP